MGNIFRIIVILVAILSYIPFSIYAFESQLFGHLKRGDYFKYPERVKFEQKANSEQLKPYSQYYKVYFDGDIPLVAFRYSGNELWNKFLFDEKGRIFSIDDGTDYCTFFYKKDRTSTICINMLDDTLSHSTETYYKNDNLIRREVFNFNGALQTYLIPNYESKMVEIYDSQGKKHNSQNFLRYVYDGPSEN